MAKATEAAEVQAPAGPITAAQAIEMAKRAQGTTLTSTDVDEQGFTRIYDKDALVGKAFTIVDFEEDMGEYGLVGVVRIVRGSKALVFKDGSTGVYAQLTAMREAGTLTFPLRCPKGLRVSRYEFDGRPASTYYLDDNASA